MKLSKVFEHKSFSRYLKVLNSVGFVEIVLHLQEVCVTAMNLSILKIPIPSSNA